MKIQAVRPTGVERFFDDEEIIVSKTDLAGRITYANSVFIRVAGYTEDELMGEQHNIIRHPDMPRCVFKFLWDTIEKGQEVFAYVINQCKNGDHYWVFAHVTPTFDAAGKICGYHSSRRVPDRRAVKKIADLYGQLCQQESMYRNPQEAMKAGLEMLVGVLEGQGVAYDEFVFSLETQQAPARGARP